MVINEVDQIAICAACNQHIKDRYLFEVTNRKWHCVCLRCTHCKALLTDKCWFRHNNLYCKDDYYKLFFSCNNCKQVIERDTFVRKTPNQIYHLQCFQCNQCGKILNSGDHYIVQGDDKLLCSNHYSNLQISLSNCATKNSCAELITDQVEGEIVVKTEQTNNLISSSNNNSSIDQQQQQPTIGHLPPQSSNNNNNNTIIHSQFTTTSSSSSSTNLIENSTMSNTIAHNHSSSPFLLNRPQSVTLSSSSSSSSNPTNLLPNSISTNSLNNSLIHHHHSSIDLIPQSLNLIDYPSPHQPSSLLVNNNKTGLNEFTSTIADQAAAAAEFYSSQSASCYVPNSQLSSLPAPNMHHPHHHPHTHPHSMKNIYEHDALHFYDSTAACSMLAPTPNSPLNNLNNEIENTDLSGVSNNSSTLTNNARKGRPRKRKQIALSSSNNAGIDALSAALHEQNLNNNNLNSSTSSIISQSLVNAISNSNGHLQNSNSSNSSSSSSNGNHQRTKRMRTSFKHAQLKMMKTYFSKNQNPDAKDLKGLAQDTLLSKRVLQVWFQNQRAKYRRHNNHKGIFNQQNLQMGQTCLGSPDNDGGSTRQFSTPSPASIMSNSSNNQTSGAHCETSLPTTNSATNLCSNGSSSSLDQYSPSNSISLLRQTPPLSVKMPSSPAAAAQLAASLHFGHHLTSNHNSSNGLINSLPNRHLTNFNTEPIMSTFQDLY